jgi:hypothetical protein
LPGNGPPDGVHVLAKALPQKAIVTECEEVVETLFIVLGFVPVVVLFTVLTFTVHTEVLLLGLKTYMTADNPIPAAPPVTVGFDAHVPL